MNLDLLREGTPWWVSVNLAQLSTSVPTDVVVPQPANPMPNSNRLLMGDGLAVNARLIILGFAWDFTSGAKNTGFTLQWRTFEANTPAGTPRTDIIWTSLSDDTGSSQQRTSGCVPYTFIAGTGGGAGSPPDRGSISNPAKLQVMGNQTSPTAGRLLIWGIHTDGDWRPGKVFSGSPDAMVFGTTTAKK
jgi:hypothetical protein